MYVNCLCQGRDIVNIFLFFLPSFFLSFFVFFGSFAFPFVYVFCYLFWYFLYIVFVYRLRYFTESENKSGAAERGTRLVTSFPRTS